MSFNKYLVGSKPPGEYAYPIYKIDRQKKQQKDFLSGELPCCRWPVTWSQVISCEWASAPPEIGSVLDQKYIVNHTINSVYTSSCLMWTSVPDKQHNDITYRAWWMEQGKDFNPHQWAL